MKIKIGQEFSIIISKENILYLEKDIGKSYILQVPAAYFEAIKSMDGDK